MAQKTDASIAFSVTDNLSQSVVGMKNSINSFRGDITQLQQKLDALDNTRFRLKNFDLKQAKNELERTKRAFEELGDAASDADREAALADFERATQNYENVRRQLDLTSKAARQAEKDIQDVSGAFSRMDNRANRSGSASVLEGLGKAGLGQMAGDAALEVANTLIGSAFGNEAGSIISSGLSGAISGAAIGSIIPGIGTAIGAAVGGAIGLAQGGTQAFESRDEAFKSYYQQLYEQSQSAAEESLSSGSSTAAQRELDAIAFNRLLGAGVGDRYLSDLRVMAAETPMEYADLTAMSRALATGFGDSPERMLSLMEAIGDAGSAVGVTASDMTEMARAMSRMNSSGKATLEFLNIFQDRGVDVIGMLGEAMGKTQGEIYEMISKSEINGQDAADIIQRGMESAYGGAMQTMAETFSGLTSTLSDAMTEIDNARGEGYNTVRSSGLQAEIDAYGGLLGSAVENLNRIAGENEAYMENLSDRYMREALSAVLLGEGTTLYNPQQQLELEDMRASFVQASADYENGSQEAGLKMDSLRQQAEALATAAYESSSQYQDMHQAELDQIAATRDLTAAFTAWTNEYRTQQAQSVGLGGSKMVAGDLSEMDKAVGGLNSAAGWYAAQKQHAYGLGRVPYDNYAALLHEGERVLTAREAREADRGGGAVTVNIGGSWQVRSDSDVDAIAEAIVRRARLARLGGIH
nr:MAG TPA: tail tape measure protein [Caudoviricetes sp.]